MINFDNTYTLLPKHFYSKSTALEFKNSKLLKFNFTLAEQLGLDHFLNKDEDYISKYFTGQIEDSAQACISQAYAGHQFGHFNPTLGDGRAMLLGEIKVGDKRYDIQLKGSGPTAYSRRGDGLSSMGPVIREYLMSESMHALGVKTTRALCANFSGLAVQREQTEAGGVFTRIASSHIRIGTFQYLASTSDYKGLKKLSDYTIDRHYPLLNKIKDSKERYLEFLKSVATAQANLIASWMKIGFIHGVMNTDNMSISGETIDYGPCAFMDEFKKNEVKSYIDSHARYAFNNQPKIGLWNIYQLANALIPIFCENPTDPKQMDQSISFLEENLNDFDSIYENAYMQAIAQKFGLKDISKEEFKILNSFYQFMEEHRLDFTNSFIKLTYSDEFDSQPELKSLFNLMKNRDQTLMQKSNPYLIPRNHIIDQIIKDILKGDERSFHEFCEVLKTPFKRNAPTHYYELPTQSQRVRNTFCGT